MQLPSNFSRWSSFKTRSPANYSQPLLLLLLQQLASQCEARGGGSKRTFGSQKTQGSQNQNLADCGTDQANCSAADASDPSWMSFAGATMALVGPLLVLLAFIGMIKLCLVHLYPKGNHQEGSRDPLKQVEPL